MDKLPQLLVTSYAQLVTIYMHLVIRISDVSKEIETQHTCFRIHESGTRMQRST